MERIILTKDLASGPQTFDEYRAEGGYAALERALGGPPKDVLDVVTESHLRGRGGAGFPTGQKWSFAAAEAAAPKYVVANGGEDEPGSQKDRVVMENVPHKVLEGVILAGYAIGASEAVLYINSQYAEATAQLQAAIRAAQSAGYLGERIRGTTFSFSVRVHPAPQEYVAGEDSASLEVIEGRAPLPREKPPFPTTRGLHGQPTVVNNVETFAYIPAIVRNGAPWFRKIGTEDNPGTMLFTLPANVRRPGVVELPVGTPLRALIEEHGGGLTSGNRIKAVLPGGPSSGFIAGDDLDVPMDRQPLMERGSSLGCGVLRIVEEGECIVEVVDEIAQFFARESCGQCPTCQMETSTLAKITSQVRSGQGTRALLDQIPKLGAFAKGKGFCSLISMPIPPLTSAMRLFPDDFTFHLEHHACPSGSAAS
ncbi:MAG TPA: NADH-ubiquinone oxidoreductase-F iron-sulfur binding region domain-containing protein [Chloroflexota bacterium]|nr:NADH-ubiquinone oxidoreductase-F iron-sulfur binding region domain-containing protein [Chloroflexota bacterium]